MQVQYHSKVPRPRLPVSAGWGRVVLFLLPLAATLLLISATGCGTAAATANPANATFAISPAAVTIDTNCTGCNTTDARGNAVHHFAATLTNRSAAQVTWSISGGDTTAGSGKISANGDYSPPGFLTADRADVLVTARLVSDPRVVASAVVTVTPGFLQPLSPENVALGASGTVTFTSRLAVAGGNSRVHFTLSATATGESGGPGTLGVTNCQRSGRAFTTCSATYVAPSTIASTQVAYVIARVDGSPSRTDAEILLNTAGVTSNPVGHQGQLAVQMPLGSSGGNNNDFDAKGNTIADCCSGTLGALVQDNAGKQYLLSNNHVLARSDHGTIGDAIVQPGLIDNNCTPSGDGAGTVPVGTLSSWLPLKSPQTNADAALAQVASHTLDATGSILELGPRQPDGTLAAAPPGVSSTAGKGERASLQMRVAKSGRTTGLTCASVSAMSLDVSVDYYRDCAETRPYLTKTFTNQLAFTGDRFSDAGDSGALVVDAADAEPVGLFFAGGTDSLGVGHGVANPAPDVLNELDGQGGGTSYSFVGSADHAVSCLSYGDSTVTAAQALPLSDSEIARAQQALSAARQMVNPASGILGVSIGKSSDHAGEAAIIVYVDEADTYNAPTIFDGVRTLVIPTNARSVALGTSPLANGASGGVPLSAATVAQAVAVKQKFVRGLMRDNPSFFAVGVGQSLDNQREAALVIYLDRKRIPQQLPQTVGGMRTHYVVMDRLHVTRSYATPVPSTRHCLPHAASEPFDPQHLDWSRSTDLF